MSLKEVAEGTLLDIFLPILDPISKPTNPQISLFLSHSFSCIPEMQAVKGAGMTSSSDLWT